MSGVTDYEKMQYGQTASVGASPPATQAAVTQSLRRRRLTWMKDADDAMASTTTAETQVGCSHVPGTVKGIAYVSGGTLTASDTTNAVITVSKRTGAGATKTTVGTLTTNVAGGNYVAGQRIAFTLTATIVDRSFLADATFSFEVAKGSTGVVLRAGAFELEYEED